MFIRKKRSADDFGDDDAEDSRFLEFDEYDPRKCLEFGCTFVNRLMILPTLVGHLTSFAL